ncbi:pseudouridine synthase [Geothrix sp. 21YS21S-4]|uniref:pseudouridine synthase n=1 Tax=Geothrix sp. 21YS21S-4 TaxID=3068889 RepID=UPI0027B88DD9|nr:pseudouridine synthase [Geothrix sp. 21YS21S-4]
MARIEREWQAEHEGAALASELHKVMVISHRQAKGFIDGRCVTVNGEIADKHGLRLKAGDAVKVAFDPELVYDVLPPAKKLTAGPYEALWEDNHLLFVFKPAGLLTVPAEQGGEPSLAEAITESYRRRGFKRFNLFIVHRLDRFTSGVLVFAKTPEALHGLKKHFELHRLQRVYRAVLVGELPENSGTLAGHLIEHAKSLKMSVAKVRKGPGGGKRMPAGAKEAVTHYRVVERLPGHTVVEVRLETGRRNQIRVQFADRGFPLLGDQVYGVESPLLDRQALHAELLGFKHPVTEDQVTVTAPMPADMEAALKALRNQARIHRASTGVQGEEGIFHPTESRDHKLKRVARAKRFEDRPDERPRRDDGERPRREDGEDRPRRPFGASDRPSHPRRDDGDERPRRTFASTDRPAPPRRDDGDERSRRTAGPTDRPARPRREDGDERPRRTFGSTDRPARPRRDDGDERPRRTAGPSDRPARPRRDDGDERPRRAFGSTDRPARPRRDDGDERPRRTAGPTDRPARPRREDGDERPRRTFGSTERPARPRRDDGDERPRRTAGPADRPARPRRDDGDERPRRTFSSTERPARPRRDDGDERPRRTAGPSDRPARPRRDDGDERPRRAFNPADRPSRPRSGEDDARPRSAHGPADRSARPRREGSTERPAGKPAPRFGKPKPRKP